MDSIIFEPVPPVLYLLKFLRFILIALVDAGANQGQPNSLPEARAMSLGATTCERLESRCPHVFNFGGLFCSQSRAPQSGRPPSPTQTWTQVETLCHKLHGASHLP